ncbi:hypothetical protein M405DRAFT_563491 [Rhizopogon salebrosus TDB-379]|nr:hypothetical protein M405DRAFT_563491 [Rhizopogon salebrosus TDB-379]
MTRRWNMGHPSLVQELPSRLSPTASKFMLPLHICARELPATSSADNLNLSQMGLIHMSSVTIFLDDARTPSPCALHSLLVTLYSENMPLLVVAG